MSMTKHIMSAALAAAAAVSMAFAGASALPAYADESKTEAEPIAQIVYRVYNPNSGEHLYTTDANERTQLADLSWSDEGVAWVSPTAAIGDDALVPVYRLYNPNAGDHYYTSNDSERDTLVGLGWRAEGTAFESGGDHPVYVAYNPNATVGTHNYTTDEAEQNTLLGDGWKYGSTSFASLGTGAGIDAKDLSLTADELKGWDGVYGRIDTDAHNAFGNDMATYNPGCNPAKNMCTPKEGSASYDDWQKYLAACVKLDDLTDKRINDQHHYAGAEYAARLGHVDMQFTYKDWERLGKPSADDIDDAMYGKIVTKSFTQDVYDHIVKSKADTDTSSDTPSATPSDSTDTPAPSNTPTNPSDTPSDTPSHPTSDASDTSSDKNDDASDTDASSDSTSDTNDEASGTSSDTNDDASGTSTTPSDADTTAPSAK